MPDLFDTSGEDGSESGGGGQLTLQGLDRLQHALQALDAGQGEERIRSGFQRRIYHLRRPTSHPSNSPPLRSSASAPSLRSRPRSGLVTPGVEVQAARRARAAQREAERRRDAAMERARGMTAAELADRIRRNLAV